MFPKLIEKWKTVEKPKEERTFNKPKILWIAILFIVSFGLGWGILVSFQLWESMLPRISAEPVRYDLPGWAASYFIYFFMMIIPLLAANIVYSKTKTPAYPFTILGGCIVAAAIYMTIDIWFGGYMVYVLALSFLANAISQERYVLKWWHQLFYFVLGIIGSYWNSVIQMHFWDVWTFLQFIHVYLFIVIIAAVKIRQWGYMYMLGWALCSIVFLFHQDLLIFAYFPAYVKANMLVVAIYNLLVPPMLVWTVLTYFFKIQRRVRSKTYNPEEQNVKV